MKNFLIVIGAIVLALFIITFIDYPSILPIHIILGIAFIIAVLGFFKMRSIGKV
jgi:hypothetical protein